MTYEFFVLYQSQDTYLPQHITLDGLSYQGIIFVDRKRFVAVDQWILLIPKEIGRHYYHENHYLIDIQESHTVRLGIALKG